jgi:periplasmic copper chaperone A
MRPIPLSAARVWMAGLCCVAAVAWAQEVTVSDAWARATVAGQKASGVFMKLTAKDNARLVGVSTPVAGVAEIHQMKMDDNVMKMSSVSVLDLPAGKPVELKPGSYHLMLMDLKAPLLKDSTVPVTLTLEDAKGVRSQLKIDVPVASQPPMVMRDHGMHN